MLVSIYLPTKNRQALLRRAVESVLTQSYTTLELIVVDDGSTDDTQSYLDTVRTADSRIRVIRNETSLGAPLSRNLPSAMHRANSLPDSTTMITFIRSASRPSSASGSFTSRSVSGFPVCFHRM